MNRKMYWGLGVLMILILGAFVLLMVNQYAENRQLEMDLAEAQKKLEAHNKEADTPHVVDISDKKPPDEPGFVWVRHGDHWDKIPTSPPADNTSQTGHWSEAYLPPMNELESHYADDSDAMFVLDKVKTVLQNGGRQSHNPVAVKAHLALTNFTIDLTSSLGTSVSWQRFLELTRLQWPLLDTFPQGLELTEQEKHLFIAKE